MPRRRLGSTSHLRRSIRSVVSCTALALVISTLPVGLVVAAAAEARGRADIPAAENPKLVEARQAVRVHDFKKAVRLWREVAKQGNARAQYRLGSAYRAGRGVDRDHAKAVYWFKKAASGGDGDAQYALGLLYQAGLGVEANRDEALRLIGLAGRGGHEKAKSTLAEIQRSGSVAFSTAEARVTANRRDPRAALTQAIRAGDLGSAREALARGAPVNGAKGDVKHWRPLILAIESDQTEMVELLLEHRANSNLESRLGESALILAIRREHRSIVRQLLAAGAAPTTKSISGYTALMEAARVGASGIVDDLLAAGSDPKIRLADGTSAADVARRFKQDAIVRRLQRAGTGFRDGDAGDRRAAALAPIALGDARAKNSSMPPVVEAARRGDAELLRALIARRVDLGVKDIEGESALHRAAAGGHVEAIRVLLGAGLAPDLRGRDEATALFRAIASTAKDSDAVTEVLLAAGADPHARDEMAKGVIDYAAEGATPRKLELIQSAGGSWSEGDAARSLERAAGAGRDAVVRALVEVVSDPRHLNLAVCGAIAGDQMTALGTLLKTRPQLGHKCVDGRTALMMAAHAGRLEAVERLLDAGANVNQPSRGGDTAMIAAASRGRVEIVKRLIASGGDVDLRGGHDMTALMGAASNAHADVVRVLLEAGADRRMRAETDQTARDLARSAGHDEIVATLESFNSGWGSWFGADASAPAPDS